MDSKSLSSWVKIVTNVYHAQPLLRFTESEKDYCGLLFNIFTSIVTLLSIKIHNQTKNVRKKKNTHTRTVMSKKDKENKVIRACNSKIDQSKPWCDDVFITFHD